MVSRSLITNVPVFVIFSAVLEPLSVVRVTVGAEGARVSDLAEATKLVKLVPVNADVSTALPPCADSLIAVAKVDWATFWVEAILAQTSVVVPDVALILLIAVLIAAKLLAAAVI